MSARNTLAAKAARRAEREASAARFSTCTGCRVRLPAAERGCRRCILQARRAVGWDLAGTLDNCFAARSTKAQVAPMGNHPTPVEIGAPAQSSGLVPAL